MHPGSGPAAPPLVCLHGFMDTPRTWDLVRPALARSYAVLTPALPGHLGGPPLTGRPTLDALADAVERAMDDAGIGTAHLAGNSLGGHLALRLAARGRARSVVALAPAGGWRGETSRETLDLQAGMHAQLAGVAPHAEALVATAEGRRRVTSQITVRHEHLPAELLAHLVRGAAAADAGRLLRVGREADWSLDVARIACPLRIVWGTEDRLLPWPAAAERLRDELPHADWIVLDGVGHSPQLDVPLEVAQLMLHP